MERAKLVEPEKVAKVEQSEYNVQFFSSGSTLLDLALGGGWALPRVFNIVGDKSTGKTLLAVEAFANFNIKFQTNLMRYAESEAAFDEVFASTLGFPDTVERPDELLNTVEDFHADFYKFIERCAKLKVPGLYILDSLDALTSDAEVTKSEKNMKKRTAPDDEDSEKAKGSYGTDKAKKMSEFFRLLTRDASDAGCSLGIVSQIRDKIGAMFGEQKMRTGGHALDFSASQVVWLAEIGKKTRQALNEQRVTGISVLSKVKKNKVGKPFREAEYDIIFEYGIDDEMSMIEWLAEKKSLVPEAKKDVVKRLEAAREIQDYKTISEIRTLLKKDCTILWKEIDAKLAPTIRKYGPGQQG